MLLPGLPFAILTQSLDYVPSVILQQMEPPPGLQFTKYYFKPQVEKLQTRFENVQGLGRATQEEWFKGLQTRGQQQNADAGRFDQWELQGGVSTLFMTGLGANSIVSCSSTATPNQGDQARPMDSAYQAWQMSSARSMSSGHTSPGPTSLGSTPHGKRLSIPFNMDYP